MSSSLLNNQVDAWTVASLSAGSHLVRLYQVLGDEKQKVIVLQILVPAEERARRVALCKPVLPLAELDLADETEAEAAAWRILIEAQAGLCAFHALVDENVGGLRGPRHAATKAWHRSLQGFRRAFPEPMAQEGILQGLHAAARTCAELFAGGLKEEGSDLDQPGIDRLRDDLCEQITEILAAEADAQPLRKSIL